MTDARTAKKIYHHAAEKDPLSCYACGRTLAEEDIRCPTCNTETFRGMDRRVIHAETVTLLMTATFCSLPLAWGPGGAIVPFTFFTMMLLIPRRIRANRAKRIAEAAGAP